MRRINITLLVFIVLAVSLTVLPGCSIAAADKNGHFSGIVQEGTFRHEDRGETFTFYFTDAGREQFEKLKNALEDYYYDPDQEVETEIQLYSTSKNINLKDYVGQTITFKGEFFEAHTAYHVRNIVFEIKEITGSASSTLTAPSAYAPLKQRLKTLSTAEKPLPADFIEYGTNFWFNGLNSEAAGRNFMWAKFDDGSDKRCLMVLIDALGNGGANRYLHIPKYGLPKISNPGPNLIYAAWTYPQDFKPNETNDLILLLFDEKYPDFMALTANALKGIGQGPDSDIVKMPVKIIKDSSGQGRYYVPLYALLNEVGGGVMFDPFGDGTAFIYTGEALQGYSGVWEVVDDTEYRVDVKMGGKTVSVGNYWWSLELRPDGVFTEIDRHYKDEGGWFRTEFKGRYAFFGRILAMKYTSCSLYIGEDYNNLIPVKVDGPFEGKYGDMSEYYAEYVDDWSRPDTLNIRGSRALVSKELSGRKW